jgi:DNA-binding transcriptional LysR family regulator
MDLRRIRHFSVLAETLNFSRAAERLHIAQPALSVSIQKLETELGTRLFERTPTGVVLTPSGQAALIEARRLLYQGEQLVRSVRDAALGTAGRLRIGFVGSAIYGLIQGLIPKFRALYPGVELELHEATSNRIMEMLNEEALEIGLIRAPVLQPSPMTILTLRRDRFIAALPQDHPLAARPRLTLSELAREPFIMYSALHASGLHRAAMVACEAAGIAPTISQEAIQIPTVLALVESGLGVALVPEVMRAHRQEHVVYRGLDGLPQAAETALALAYQAGLENPAAERFIELARSQAVT